MYANLTWLDHAVTPDRTFTMTTNPDGTVTLTPAGTVVQQGTNMSAANFNNIELGLTDHDLAVQILLMLVRNLADRADLNDEDVTALADDLITEVTTEEISVTLTNTGAYPYNNSAKSVSFGATRKTTNWTCEATVTANDGNVGEIEITNKKANGLTVAFTGSATSVTVTLKIKGGIIA